MIGVGLSLLTLITLIIIGADFRSPNVCRVNTYSFERDKPFFFFFIWSFGLVLFIPGPGRLVCHLQEPILPELDRTKSTKYQNVAILWDRSMGG